MSERYATTDDEFKRRRKRKNRPPMPTQALIAKPSFVADSVKDRRLRHHNPLVTKVANIVKREGPDEVWVGGHRYPGHQAGTGGKSYNRVAIDETGFSIGFLATEAQPVTSRRIIGRMKYTRNGWVMA